MRETWEEARALGVEPDPLDGIYYANQPELNAQFPGMGFGPGKRRDAGFDLEWAHGVALRTGGQEATHPFNWRRRLRT